jgi:hypothetical protein
MMPSKEGLCNYQASDSSYIKNPGFNIIKGIKISLAQNEMTDPTYQNPEQASKF